MEEGHWSIFPNISASTRWVSRIGSSLLKGLLKYSSKRSLPPVVRVKSSLWKIEYSSSRLKRDRSSYVILSISMVIHFIEAQALRVPGRAPAYLVPEPQALAPLRFIEDPISINQMTIYESMGHCCRKLKPFQGAPATFIENALRTYPGGGIHVHYDQVCEVSFADITSFGYTETGGYGMAHLFHYLFETDPAFPDIMQHQQKRMLYQRQSGVGLFVWTTLFLPCMRSMIRGDEVQPVFQ